MVVIIIRYFYKKYLVSSHILNKKILKIQKQKKKKKKKKEKNIYIYIYK